MTDNTNDNSKRDALHQALDFTAEGSAEIAKELRSMANAYPPYDMFENISPIIKNIWHAAAMIIEERNGHTEH